MARRILRSIMLAGLANISVFAQSYQTSFSDVKFDRAKGPATFNAGVEVDAATGAASLSIPFGPGIGERGLKFRPMLSMRMAPQLGISSADENVVVSHGFGAAEDIWGPETIDTLYQRGFGTATFSPGTLDLGNLVSGVYQRKTSFNLPGGGGGRVLGVVPSEVTTATVESLLGKFGFSSTETVGYLPGATTRTVKSPFIQMSSSGHLVVGLRVAGPANQITDEVLADIQQTPSSTYRWDLPRRMVVIQGDVAYEFHYTNHSYLTRAIPYLAINQKTQLESGHYVITKIRNRFGESIEFTYDVDGIGYTALWKLNPSATSGPSIRVAVLGNAAPPPNILRLSDSKLSLSQTKQIRITYLGISRPVSTYLLELSDPQLGEAIVARSGGGPESPGATGPNGQFDSDTSMWNAAVQSVQPLRVVQEATNEEIRFGYSTAETTNWGADAVAPTVLSTVTTPTRTVQLSWKPYSFRMNYSAEGWGGMVSSSAPCRPAYAYGVVSMGDSDGNQIRGSGHTRVTPTSNWGYYQGGTAPPDEWVSTAFYDAITHEDGTVSVHRFVEPANGMGTVLQSLAFIKTLEREVRHYTPGVDWQADLGVTNPASSSAFKWVVKDRFDVRTAGAPTGDLNEQSVPYPTRVRTWDKESQVLTTEETTDWDVTAAGWKTVSISSVAGPG
jgi:hypothetical protein